MKFLFFFLGLQTAITKAYTPSPMVTIVREVVDIKSWILPHLNDIHGHTTPLCFKFMLVNEKATMYYRHWSTDPWCDKGVILLKVNLHMDYNTMSCTYTLV